MLIYCDNEALVTVLKSGKMYDPYLAACTQNSCMHRPAVYTHGGEAGRGQGTLDQIQLLHAHIKKPVWLPVSYDTLHIYPEL